MESPEKRFTLSEFAERILSHNINDNKCEYCKYNIDLYKTINENIFKIFKTKCNDCSNNLRSRFGIRWKIDNFIPLYNTRGEKND